MHLSKGSKTDLVNDQYVISIVVPTAVDTADTVAVLPGASGQVRTDHVSVFFNDPKVEGVTLLSNISVSVDRRSAPLDVERVLIIASTEAAHGKRCKIVLRKVPAIRTARISRRTGRPATADGAASACRSWAPASTGQGSV